MNTIKLKFMAKVLGVLLIIVYLTSCASESPRVDVAVDNVGLLEDYKAVESTSKISAENSMTDTIHALKIIKSANVRFKVENVNSATKQINSIIKVFGGYISDQRFQNTKYQIENRFTLKVPKKHFEKLLDSLTEVAEFVDYQNITSDDVTENYVDVQSRLKTKLEIKKRYEAILRNRTGSIKDVLEAEEKIGLIQEEIEAAKGRLNYLSSKVAFSTIQVDLYETVNYVEQPESYKRTFFSKMKEGLKYGWKLVESIVLGLIYIWPLVIIAVLTIIVVRRKIKK